MSGHDSEYHNREGRSFWTLLGFALLALGARWLLIAHFGSATPMHDEWDGFGYHLFRPLVAHQLGFADLLQPFNEHRIVLTRLYSIALLKLDGGIWNPLLQMTLNAFIQTLGLCSLLAALLPMVSRRREFLLLAALLLVPPLAVENALVGFQSQFYLLMALSVYGLGALASAQTYGRRWWLGAAACAASALAMASGAITLLVASALVALRGQGRARLLALPMLLLALASLATMPSVHTFDEIRAHTPMAFILAALRVFSWPAGTLPLFTFASDWQPSLGLLLISGLMVLCWLPLGITASRLVRQPPGGQDVRWPLLAISVWLVGQLLAICYSRAGQPITSRYVDLFVMGLVLNSACLLQARQFPRWGLLWLLAVGVGLVTYASHLPPFLAQKLAFTPVADANVRAYLATHDYSILLNNPYPYIPYAEPGFLKQCLDDPSLVAVLPSNLVPGHATAESGLVAALIQHLTLEGSVLMILGAGLGALTTLRYGPEK